eukprot:COSAG04_NODE_5393_length_1632_cov_2.051533_2_plen_251_part_01
MGRARASGLQPRPPAPGSGASCGRGWTCGCCAAATSRRPGAARGRASGPCAACAAWTPSLGRCGVGWGGGVGKDARQRGSRHVRRRGGGLWGTAVRCAGGVSVARPGLSGLCTPPAKLTGKRLSHKPSPGKPKTQASRLRLQPPPSPRCCCHHAAVATFATAQRSHTATPCTSVSTMGMAEQVLLNTPRPLSSQPCQQQVPAAPPPVPNPGQGGAISFFPRQNPTQGSAVIADSAFRENRAGCNGAALYLS